VYDAVLTNVGRIFWFLENTSFERGAGVQSRLGSE
jgi:hypothetical protein